MSPIYINRAGIVCTLGANPAAVERELFRPGSGQYLTFSDRFSAGQSLPLGLVEMPLAAVAVPGEDSRSNRMLAAALMPLLPEVESLKARFGAQRIGIVIGTSTSGIATGEAALDASGDDVSLAPEYCYTTQELSAPVRFLSQWLGIEGPCWTLSSACTSGGKALASAARLLRLGVCDAVIAGGVDTLCRMTVAGFSSLLVTADTICNPFSIHRRGINIGEGAAVFVLSREPGPVRLAGWGESSDAHHISSPDPQGRSAEAAMRGALTMAGLEPPQVDYLNLHGTATAQNDLMEAIVVQRVFGNQLACSSTKPLTGHTLAAAGAIEALFCWLLLQRKDATLPPQRWDEQQDPALPTLHGLGRARLEAPARVAMSNSFAFGGNNLSLLMTREDT